MGCSRNVCVCVLSYSSWENEMSISISCSALYSHTTHHTTSCNSKLGRSEDLVVSVYIRMQLILVKYLWYTGVTTTVNLNYIQLSLQAGRQTGRHVDDRQVGRQVCSRNMWNQSILHWEKSKLNQKGILPLAMDKITTPYSLSLPSNGRSCKRIWRDAANPG